MISHFYTKFLTFALVVSLLIPGTLFLYPETAKAGTSNCAAVVAGAVASIVGISTATKAVVVPTGDPGTQAGAASITGSAYGTFFKDCILTPIAIQLGKAMLRNITNSIVNWINSGFEGKPTFVTDFNGLVTDTTDQVIGNFIDRDLGLGFLCNSFSLQIRIALAQTYMPYQQRARCTLSQIEQNVNGFVQGDNAGGWNNWLSVTTEPQNNIYGATILAQNELSQRIANKLGVQRDMLNRNKGFFDLQVCDEYESQAEADTRVVNSQPNTTSSGSSFQNFNTGAVTFGDKTTILPTSQQSPTFSGKIESSKPECKHYTTKTPGAVVESQLNNALGTDVRQLELANDIDMIIGALANQLMSKVITGAQGLLGAGKSSNGSYNTTTYQNAFNQTVDPNLSNAIDTGVTQATNDANLNTLFPTNSSSQNSSTTASGADLSWLVTEAPNTMTLSTPLTYELDLLANKSTSGLTVTTTLRRDGVAVPFLNVFSSLQLSYGRSSAGLSNMSIGPTDGSASWTNVSVDDTTRFIIRYRGFKSFDDPVGTYSIDTVVTDSSGAVITSTSDNFAVQQ